jgi:asparagine synthase (glutamine-hydrolysing)
VLAKGKRPVHAIHAEQNNYFNNSQLQQLGFPVTQNATNGYSFQFESTVSDAMKMDIENYMPGDILVKTDRAAMASSLELRAPFLDKDLASFCISLPYKLKLNYKEEKIIAKQAFQNLLPGSIVKRRKQGFGAPVTSWLASSSLQQLKNEYLGNRNKKIFSLLDFDHTQKIIKEDNYNTWILLVLSLWLEKH